MTKLVLSFVLLLYLSTSHSQAIAIDSFIADCKAAIPSMEKLNIVIAKYKKDTSAFRIYSRVPRVNYFELVEDECMIQKRDLTRENGLLFRYKLEFFSTDNRVVYCRLYKSYDSRELWTDRNALIEYNDTNRIKEYLIAFNQKYLTSYSDVRYVFSTEHDIFGISWGLAFPGMKNVYQPMEDVYKMVKEKDISSLLKLCRSGCNETKCYGATGLLLLQKEGFILDNEAHQLLTNICQSNDKISFAWGGCEIERSEISKELTEKYLEEVYNSYTFYKIHGLQELR